LAVADADAGVDEAGGAEEAGSDDGEEGEASAPARESPQVAKSRAQRDRNRVRGFLRSADGSLALDPSELISPDSARAQLLLALVLGMLSMRRREVSMLAILVATVVLVLHVPSLCTALVRLFGAPWIVRRMLGVLEALATGTIPAVVGHLIMSAPVTWLHRGLVLTFALGLGYVHGVDHKAWKRREVLSDALSGAPLQRFLRSQHRRSRLFEGQLPPRAVLVTSLGRAPEIAATWYCHPLALPPPHGTPGARDRAARRAALRRILSLSTPPEERIALMRRFGTRHIHLGRTKKTKKLEKALRPWLIDTRRSKAGVLLHVDTTEDAHLRERPTHTR
jgi:hypothetical protein